MKITEFITEAANPAQQAAIAISKKDEMAEGEGNFEKALDTLSGNWSGWHKIDSHDPNVDVYNFDDGEGGYYASGTIEHDLQTGKVTVDYGGDEYHGPDVKGTFDNFGEAMRALRGGGGSHGGRAPNFDRLGHREPYTSDDLYKSDRVGRKGSLSGGASNRLKQSIQHNKGNLGPKGVLPEDVEQVDEKLIGKQKNLDKNHTSKLEEGTCTECGMYEDMCECGSGMYEDDLYENCSVDSYSNTEQDNLSINTSYSTRDNRKFVTISAEGEQAEALLQMLKLAGLTHTEHAQRAQALVIAQEAKDYGNTEVDKPEEHSNTPRPKHADVDMIKKMGADLNRPKKQFADKPKAGDNPMATHESIDPLKTLGRDLMKMYKGIQK